MRLKASFIVLIFFSSLFVGAVQGTTPDTITVDGDVSDWDPDTLMGTDANGVELRLSWNESMLFLGWEGTDWKATSGGADLFVYMNTTEGVRFSHEIGVLLMHYRSQLTMPLCWKTIRTTNTLPTTEVHGKIKAQMLSSMLVGQTTK